MINDSHNREIIAGLDVGSSQVVVVVAERHANGSVEVIGRASHPSQGLKQGIVVNIESTVHAIRESVRQAELMAGCRIGNVYVGISGNHIGSRDTAGMVAISNKEVTGQDVQRVLDSASTVAITADQHVLHILPQEYIIDSQSGIQEPVGMSGVRLEAKVHMVTCASSAVQNLSKCINQCGLEIKAVVLEPLAASEATLTEDERELGACVIDIGAGTTDLVVFIDGSIRHIANIPVAGQQVTRDIAMLLRTPNHDAEKIKTHHAYAWTQLASSEEIIEVPSVGGRAPREMSLATLAPAVEARYEALFNDIHEHLMRAGYWDLLRAGLIFTGGASKVRGLVELAEETLEVPARIGEPHGIDSVIPDIYDPQYATVVGLIKYAHSTSNPVAIHSVSQQGETEGLSKRFKGWVSKHF